MSDNLEVTAINLERDIAFSVADDKRRKGMKRGAIFLGSIAAAFLGLIALAAVTPRDKDLPSARVPPSFRDKDVPSARVPHGHDGAYVLACQSVDQYRQLAPIFTLGNGPPVVRAINMKECYQINDRAEYGSAMQPHHFYRVESIEAGLACVWALDSPGGCYWTRADNLHHIGRGPQLSEDQFRDVRVLYRRVQDLRKLESDYYHQIVRVKGLQGDRREEARLRKLAKQAEDQFLAIEDRIAQFQPTEPPPETSGANPPSVAVSAATSFLGDAGSQTSSPAPHQNDLDFSNLVQLHEGPPPLVKEPRVLRIEREDYIGCRDWFALQRIINSSHDANAFSALLLPRLATTECLAWDVGTQIRKGQIEPPVARDDVSRIFFKCYARIDDAGPCYWTNVDATVRHGG